MNKRPSIILADLASRLRSELPLKLFLTIALNLWAYAPYQFLQRHHFFPATIMPAGAVDRAIPFVDQAVWIYLSVYLLMPIGPFLMNRRPQILRYAAGIIVIGLAAYLIFLFWPTICPRPSATGTGAIYRLLVGIDNPFHACPSLHAAFAVYSGLCTGLVWRELRISAAWLAGIWIWVLLILLATLATKQHMLADIAAGSVLGFGAYYSVFVWRQFAVESPGPFQPLSTEPEQTHPTRP